MYLLKMAWRNLGRRRSRTILSLLSVAVGVFVVITAKGFVEGMVDTMLDYSINFNSGHIRLIRPEYEAKERVLSLSYPLGEQGKSYSAMIGEIRRLPGVVEAMGRIRFGLLLTRNDGREELVLGLGADLKEEDRVVKLSRFLRGGKAGRLPRAGRRELLLGAELMRQLHLKVGDKVNALFSTSFGSVKIATFRVAGRMESGLRYLDETVAYLPLDTAMDLLDFEDAVTEIVVFAKETGRTANLQATLGRYLSGEQQKLLLVPWYRFNEMIAYLGQVKTIYLLFYAFIVLLAAFVVFNTLVMVISERTREIGLLAALGLMPREIGRLFLWEAGLLAVIGSSIGVLLGGGLGYLTSRTGIDVAGMVREIGAEFFLAPRIYPRLGLSDLLFGFILGIAVTLAAASLPVRKAGRLKPTEALRAI